MPRRLLATTKATIGFLLATVLAAALAIGALAAPSATAAAPLIQPSRVDIHSAQAPGGGLPAEGSVIRIKGQVFFLTAYQQVYSNVGQGQGTVTISRRLAGESQFTAMVTVGLGDYGIFVADLPAVRNASYQASYSGWKDIRDPNILKVIGCDTPCDRLAQWQPSVSSIVSGPVTRQLSVGKPRAVGRAGGVYWKQMRRPYRVAVRVAPQYAGRLVTVERQVGCLGDYRAFTSARIRANSQGIVTLRRKAAYSCFRFSISGDANFAPGSIERRLGARGWLRPL